MRIRIVAARPKAQQRDCKGCPEYKALDTQRDTKPTLIGISMKPLRPDTKKG
jgi:hypothetical protein